MLPFDPLMLPIVINSGTYAFFFNQRGLMAGLGLKGSKITRINPGR